MRRVALRAAYALALMATGFAMGASMGWLEMPADVRAELGGY